MFDIIEFLIYSYSNHYVIYLQTINKIERVESKNQILRDNYQQLRDTLQELKITSSLRMQKLTDENLFLKNQLEKAEAVGPSFLNECQIKKIKEGNIREWSNESIIKGIKFRFALGVSEN